MHLQFSLLIGNPLTANLTPLLGAPHAQIDVPLYQRITNIALALGIPPDREPMDFVVQFLASDLFRAQIWQVNELLGQKQDGQDRTATGIEMGQCLHLLGRHNDALDCFRLNDAQILRMYEGLRASPPEFTGLKEHDFSVHHEDPEGLPEGLNIPGEVSRIVTHFTCYGEILFSLGLHDQALKQYKKALWLSQKVPDGQEQRAMIGALMGQTLIKMERTDEAITYFTGVRDYLECCDKKIRFSPETVRLEKLCNYLDPEDDSYRQSLNANAASLEESVKPRMLRDWGCFRMIQENYLDAEAHFRKALESQNESTTPIYRYDVSYRLANCLTKLGRYDESLIFYAQAAQVCPKDQKSQFE